MSVWYHLDVTCIANDKAAIAKFFGLRDSWEDVRTEHFEFSFGGKNAPGLTLRTIIEKNPDLIFLIHQQVEHDTSQWFIMRWDQVAGAQQSIFIQDSGEYNNEINKKIWEEFVAKHPGLPPDHWFFKNGHEKQKWQMHFSDFIQSAMMLSNASQYEEMVSSPFEYDPNFDNQPLDDE